MIRVLWSRGRAPPLRGQLIPNRNRRNVTTPKGGVDVSYFTFFFYFFTHNVLLRISFIHF